jgi:hypothetical protein
VLLSPWLGSFENNYKRIKKEEKGKRGQGEASGAPLRGRKSVTF